MHYMNTFGFYYSKIKTGLKTCYFANLFKASLAACCSALFLLEPIPVPKIISSILTAISKTGLLDGPVADK